MCSNNIEAHRSGALQCLGALQVGSDAAGKQSTLCAPDMLCLCLCSRVSAGEGSGRAPEKKPLLLPTCSESVPRSPVTVSNSNPAPVRTSLHKKKIIVPGYGGTQVFTSRSLLTPTSGQDHFESAKSLL